MARFFLRRLGLTLITLVLVSIIVFGAAQIIPGDVGRTILGPYASNEQVAALDHKLGYDQSLPKQYWTWITNFVQGDWGTSPTLNRPVRPLVLTAFKNSLYLAVYAFFLIVPLSILLGVSTLIPIGDFITVLAYRRRGPTLPLAIHGATAL